MAQINQELHDDTIRHAVFLVGLEGGVAKRMLRLIREVQADINAKLANSPPLVTAARLQRLLESVKQLHRELTLAVNADLGKELSGVAAYEAGFTHRLLSGKPRFADLGIVFDKVTAADVRSAATTRPFKGPQLAWATKTEQVNEWGRRRFNRVQAEIKLGFVEGEGIGSIASRIRNVARMDEKTAEAIARTAVNHYAATARETYYEENSHVIVKQRWTAILDGRTCPICAALDGQISVPGGKDGPRPPAHTRCRCTLTPVVDRSLDPDPLPLVTWNDWLRTQPRSFVRDVLGPSRAKLYLDGGLKLDKFIDPSGRLYTLEQLAAKEATAFNLAGAG
jgi:SPP1 gp7 family putative phage head morphogenesis protein